MIAVYVLGSSCAGGDRSSQSEGGFSKQLLDQNLVGGIPQLAMEYQPQY